MTMKRRLLSRFLFALLATLLVVWAHPILATVPRIPTQSAELTTAQSPQDWEQIGRSRFQSGQYTEAAAAFESAAEHYQAQGNFLKAAINLSNLALCQQQLSLWKESLQSIKTSQNLLQNQVKDSRDRQSALAQAFDIQGSLYFTQGNPQQALESWQTAQSLHQALGNTDRVTETQINQAEALQALGNYRRAIALLVNVLSLNPNQLDHGNGLTAQLAALPASPITITALQSLGEALRVTGNLDSAQILLTHSLKLAERIQQPEVLATGHLKLGNVIRTQAIADLALNNLTIEQAIDLLQKNQQGRKFQNTEFAIAFDTQMQHALAQYQQAEKNTIQLNTRIQAQLNQLSLLKEINKTEKSTLVFNQLKEKIITQEELSPFTKINFAQHWINQSANQLSSSDAVDLAKLLATAAQQAKKLNVPRAESFSLGALGKLYERTGQLNDALTLTQQALLIAQLNQAPDIAYGWQWQEGRILKAQGNLQAAIAAYQTAIKTLASVRKELAASALTEQFAFRDTIEPIHRELVTLLLDTQHTTPKPENLAAVRDAIESLQLTELVNFFREDCLVVRREQIDQTDPTAAVLYPIVLPDRLAVIVSLPGQPLTYYTTAQTAGFSTAQLETLVNQLRQSLKQGNIPESDFLPAAEQLYDWLIRPIQQDLIAKQIKTLVFIPDGVLRNIPMTVLRDRQNGQYLIEQYSVALTPGLQLLGSRKLTQTSLKTLAAGLTEARSGFSALPNVATELQRITAQVQNSQVFLNDRFTGQNFQANLKTVPFPIVHLATHGQFSSRLENTFILTWDGRLNINELKDVLQASAVRAKEPLELLVLSACETAAGDNRAALGLAGMAVRAGARSTIATLWQVNDASSAIAMEHLYRELAQPNRTKAEALRQTQLSLLKNTQSPEFRHPYYWAAYVLTGNWQ